MTASQALLLTRLVHTAIWAVMAASILALPFVAAVRRFDIALAITLLVVLEGIALGACGGSCPLTPLAARYTAEQGPAFDIFLPEFLARWNKAIFGTLFFAGEVVVIIELLRSGDRLALARQAVAMLLGSATVAFAFLGFTLRHLDELGIRASHPRVLVEALLAVGLSAAGVIALRAMPARVDLHPPVQPPAKASFLLADDGTRLFFEIDTPGDVKAIAWIVQGIEVASGPVFPALYSSLRNAGVGVATMHPRGTGFSDGPRGDLEDFGRILDDERAFARALRTRFPTTPIALVGHSAGAAFALEIAATLREDVRLDGIVLVNPAVKRREGGVGPSARELATYVAYTLFRPAAPIAEMSGDPARIRDPDDRRDAERARTDPVRVPRFSMRFLLGLRGVMNRSVENARSLEPPLLVISGEDDEVIDPVSGDEIARAWRGGNVEVRRVPGGHGTAVVEKNAHAITEFLTRVVTAPPR